MIGASAIEICVLPRDLLPRTLSQTGLGAAAPLKAPSTVRRRNVRVYAQCAPSCEVSNHTFHHCHQMSYTVQRTEGITQCHQQALRSLTGMLNGAGAGGSTQVPAELCPGTEALQCATCVLNFAPQTPDHAEITPSYAVQPIDGVQASPHCLMIIWHPS